MVQDTGSEFSAASSKDSALQWVDITLYERDDLSKSKREDLIAPVEAQMREHFDEVMRDGMSKAFRANPDRGAEYVIGRFKSIIDYDDVPEEHHDRVEELVEQRLDEKHWQIADVFHDIREDALRRATVVPEDTLVNWGPVV